ncbi:MAG: hypothetical protein WCJ37_02180 [Syntrophus sp. (in: bacteria)]
MANFNAITASNGAQVIPGKEADIQSILDCFLYGDVTVAIEGGQLQIYGYDWLDVRSKDKERDDDDSEILTEEFLEQISVYLAEPFILQMIGAEKCVFPLSACQMIAYPSGKVTTSFWEETATIERKVQDDTR